MLYTHTHTQGINSIKILVSFVFRIFIVRHKITIKVCLEKHIKFLEQNEQNKYDIMYGLMNVQGLEEYFNYV